MCEEVIEEARKQIRGGTPAEPQLNSEESGEGKLSVGEFSRS